MYQHIWSLSLVLAAAPLHAGGPRQTQKPAPPDNRPHRPAAAKGVRTVEIIGTEDMKFSMPTITAKPGEQLRVRLVVKGAMPKMAMAHNFVLLNKGAKVVDFVTAGHERARDRLHPRRQEGRRRRRRRLWPARVKRSRSSSRFRPPRASIPTSARSPATSRPA